jgi:hypothetical protein
VSDGAHPGRSQGDATESTSPPTARSSDLSRDGSAEPLDHHAVDDPGGNSLSTPNKHPLQQPGDNSLHRPAQHDHNSSPAVTGAHPDRGQVDGTAISPPWQGLRGKMSVGCQTSGGAGRW